MPDITFNGVPFEEAIANLKGKVNIPTGRWDELLGEAHAKAFTVAGATKASLLIDLHSDISEALKNGESITDFRKRFDKTVQKHGWQYKGKRGWRTRVIYDNNFRTAHMAGRWKQIERNKKAKPYLIYMTVDDNRVREDHRSWHKLALKVDDPFWSTHYPPNGWGCRCYVISANQKMAEKLDAEIVENPGIIRTERISTTTGEVYGEVPEGIDTGWDYNVGKAWLGPDISLGEKLVDLANNNIDFKSTDAKVIGESWRSWLKQVDAADHPRGYAHTVGFLGADLIRRLKEKDIAPKNAAVIVYDNQTKHLQGDHKSEKKRIPEEWLQQLPERFNDYEAVLLHKGTNNILFVLPETVGSKKARAVIEVNFKRKGSTFNSLRSLGLVEVHNLRKKDYEVLDGEITE